MIVCCCTNKMKKVLYMIHLYLLNKELQKLVIPSYIKKIEPSALEDCSSINHFKLSRESNLKFIHKNVLKGINIKDIILPKQLFNVQSYLPNYKDITLIGIIDDEVNIEKNNLISLPKLNCLSFPYAKKINIGEGCHSLLIYKSNKSTITGHLSKHVIKNIDEELMKTNIYPTEDEHVKFLRDRINHH